MNKLSYHISTFLTHLGHDHSRKTVENYSFYLSRFTEWLGDKKTEAINGSVIEKYQKWLGKLIDVHGDPLKNNTQNYHLIALRSFLKYLRGKNVKVPAAKTIKLAVTPKTVPVFLDRSEINRLLEALIAPATQSGGNKLIQCRDRAILELLLSTGLRVSALARLKRADDIGSNQARYWIKKYLALRSDRSEHLFISHDKRSSPIISPLTARSVQRIVQKYARLAGINKVVTPHTLRHTYAKTLA